jgi:hypothetical protein
MEPMATITANERERFALFTLLNPLQCQNRAESRRLDSVWTALRLDELAEKCSALRKGAPFGDDAFDATTTAIFEVSAADREALRGYLDKPMTGGMVRLLARIGDQVD